MYFTICVTSSFFNCGCGAMGTSPQLPLPPLITLFTSVSIFASVAGYLAATSLYAGPITFVSILWQVKQSEAAINLAPGETAPEASVPILLALVSALDSDCLAVWLAAAVLSALLVLELPPQAVITALIHSTIKTFFMDK